VNSETASYTVAIGADFAEHDPVTAMLWAVRELDATCPLLVLRSFARWSAGRTDVPGLACYVTVTWPGFEIADLDHEGVPA
jgi:hypothetical protein